MATAARGQRILSLRFPLAGVQRRFGYRDSADWKPPFPSPWAVNIRPEDPLARRLRGGSRPGLTEYSGTYAGSTIGAMLSVQVSSESGADTKLVVLADAVGFLVAGQQYAYAIAAGGITKIDPKTGGTEALTAVHGTLPTGNTFGAIYRDRLFLAGADNAIWPSAVGDYTDWDTSLDASKTTRALPPFQLSGAANVGALPTALVPFRDRGLLAVTAGSLWAIRGDPGTADGLSEVSSHVGILAPRAWCQLDEGPVAFLATDGVYQVGPDGGTLTNLSGQRLPVELRDIDTATTTVLLGYDRGWQGVHIYLTTAAGGDTHWFFHLETQTFWPMRLQDDHSPTAVCEHEGQLLLAGTDGYIRSVGGADDDGQEIESHVLLGPIALGGEPKFGQIVNLHGLLGDGSGTVYWRIVTGDTPEDAAARGKAAIEAYQDGGDYAMYVAAEGTWSEGRSRIAYPRVRGVWAVLWLSSVAQWAYEQAVMQTAPSARWR